MNSLVDAIFVIGMDKSSPRMRDFHQMMGDWTYNFFEGINVLEIADTDKLWEMIPRVNFMNNGEVGCSMSHISIWKKVIDQGMERALIFEDDARTYSSNEDIVSSLQEFYEYLKDNSIEEPDMLYLGKCLDKCSSYEKIYTNVYRGRTPFCTHSYIITKKGAQKLLSMNSYSMPIDYVITRKIDKGYIDAFVFHPSMYTQEIFSMKIGEKLVGSSGLRSVNNAMGNLCECQTNSVTPQNYYYIGGSIALLILLFMCVFYIY